MKGKRKIISLPGERQCIYWWCSAGIVMRELSLFILTWRRGNALPEAMEMWRDRGKHDLCDLWLPLAPPLPLTAGLLNTVLFSRSRRFFSALYERACVVGRVWAEQDSVMPHSLGVFYTQMSFILFIHPDRVTYLASQLHSVRFISLDSGVSGSMSEHMWTFFFFFCQFKKNLLAPRNIFLNPLRILNV